MRHVRPSRAAVEAEVADDGLLRWLSPRLEPGARRFLDGLRTGVYDGHLEASTAVRVASLLRYATAAAPLDAYEMEHGRVGTPSAVVEDLSQALTRAVEELTRPIDAIKHQAKTVTVGISRSDETLLAVPLVQAVLAAGAPAIGSATARFASWARSIRRSRRSPASLATASTATHSASRR